MAQRYWTRDSVVEALINVYKTTGSLRTDTILKAKSGLHNALYWEYKEGRLFPSVEAARQEVARRFRNQGDLRAYEEILSFNEPQKAPNKFSEQDKRQRREDLIKRLRAKIDSKENVSMRAQYKTDRAFVTLCQRAFGTYRAAFDSAGFNYDDYQITIKRSRDFYLKKLISHIKSGKDFDCTSVMQEDIKLARNLDQRFGGYYLALEEARKVMVTQGEGDIGERATRKYWQKKKKEDTHAAIKSRNAKVLEQMVIINSDREYTSQQVPQIQFSGRMKGRELVDLLQDSGEWITSFQVSAALGCTDANVVKNLVLHFPGKVARYNQGKRHRFLFHKSVLEKYKRKNPESSPKDSVNQLAKSLGVSYSKVRQTISSLGLGDSQGKYNALSPQDIEIVRQAFEREKVLYERAISAVSLSGVYTISQLEKMGVPIAHFSRAIRLGELPSASQEVRAVSGENVLDYLKENKDNLRFSQGLSLISFFHPHLHTISDLLREFQIDRTAVHYKLERLLEESPESCFRIRKSEERSKILATDEALTFLRNWATRGSFQLASVLDRFISSPGKREVEDALKGDFFDSDFIIRRGLTTNAFAAFRTLGNFQEQKQNLGDTDLAQRDVMMLCSYMASHKYDTLDLGKRYSLADLEEMVSNRELLKKVIEKRRLIGFALSRSNEKLINKILFRLNLNPDLYFQAGQEALERAIEKFDVSTGFRFSTYAWPTIKRGVLREAHRKTVSLYTPTGEEAHLMDSIEAKPEDKSQILDANDFSNNLREILLVLSQEERVIIEKRFGFDGNSRKTLEEIGAELNLSKERIRQIESRALGKLSRNPKAKLLNSLLI